jgi:hypothetical protein
MHQRALFRVFLEPYYLPDFSPPTATLSVIIRPKSYLLKIILELKGRECV